MMMKREWMIDLGSGWLGDIQVQRRKIPCNVEGIRRRIENNAQEQFILMTVPELLFWHLGLEYVWFRL